MEHTNNAKIWEDADISEQIQNTTLQIVALQEIRWKGYGHTRKKDYSLYYSCNPDTTGQFGKGFLVKKEIEKNILGFEPYNERLCKLRIKGKYHNLSLICAHAPTEDSDNTLRIYKEYKIVSQNTMQQYS